MRPVDLIPADQRRGAQAPLRRGPLAYILVAALVAVLAGVAAVVITDNQISERKAEAATLEVENDQARAEAERLAPYVEFQAASASRAETVASLAESRFDWERVMRELALILPGDVWLVSLTGSVTPGAANGSEAGLRGEAPGPALSLSGCTKGQDGVARFVTALRDIEGVTRVGVESSELGGSDGGSGKGSGDSGSECRTREFIARFEIVVSFDAAPVPPESGAEEAPPAEAEEAEVESKPTGNEGGEAE